MLLRRVRDRIDREYASPLDVESLAREVGFSAGHLSREFRAAYGESPYSYLMTRRIERAMTLLRRGDLSVTEVCFAVGYGSLGTFTTFKASNGVIAETGEGKLSLGRWVDGRMMAYGAFTQVSPGDSGAKTKGFVAWSKDGKTVDTVLGDGTERSFVGKSVQDYLHYLRETEGLTGADAKEYLNVAFLVMGCESGEVDEGEIVNIVLAPSSITAFRAYESQLQLGARAAAMGLKTKADLSGDPFRFRFSCVQASNTKNQRWSKLVIEQIKA